MNSSLTTTMVILLALFLANLPFINERLFSIASLAKFPKKPFWMRLIELFVFYFVLGFVAFAIESNAGNRFEQTWEFFAITVCLFIVFSFPGFVYCYLLKKHK